jgi:hypothetical protein
MLSSLSPDSSSRFLQSISGPWTRLPLVSLESEKTSCRRSQTDILDAPGAGVESGTHKASGRVTGVTTVTVHASVQRPGDILSLLMVTMEEKEKEEE